MNQKLNHMFTLTGQVVHVFESPTGVNKSTGEEYGGQDKVQILGDLSLPNGETRKEMVTLTTDQGEMLKKAVGRSVVAPVGFYASKGTVGFFIPKGAQIALLGPSGS